MYEDMVLTLISMNINISKIIRFQWKKNHTRQKTEFHILDIEELRSISLSCKTPG